MAKAEPRTLVDFVKDKRRASCVVCKLPDIIRQQVRAASEKKISRRTVLEWLETECGAKITDADIATHSNGHHEDR